MSELSYEEYATCSEELHLLSAKCSVDWGLEISEFHKGLGLAILFPDLD